MQHLFGHQPTVKEQVKETRRTVERGQREIARDAQQLDREEARLKLQIKEAAKRGADGEVKVLAKQIVRLRSQKERMTNMRAQLGTVKTTAVTMGATATVAETVGKTTTTMKSVNKQMDPGKLRNQMVEMQRQMAAAGVTEEMMDETLDQAFDDDEELADDIMRQTLEEIGVSSAAALGTAPSHAVAHKTAAPAAAQGGVTLAGGPGARPLRRRGVFLVERSERAPRRVVFSRNFHRSIRVRSSRKQACRREPDRSTQREERVRREHHDGRHDGREHDDVLEPVRGVESGEELHPCRRPVVVATRAGVSAGSARLRAAAPRPRRSRRADANGRATHRNQKRLILPTSVVWLGLTGVMPCSGILPETNARERRGRRRAAARPSNRAFAVAENERGARGRLERGARQRELCKGEQERGERHGTRALSEFHGAEPRAVAQHRLTTGNEAAALYSGGEEEAEPSATLAGAARSCTKAFLYSGRR